MKKACGFILLPLALWAQAGHWQGKIKMGENKDLPVTVDLARDAQGAWIGSMSIPGSTTVDVPVTVNVNDTTVRFAADLPQRAAFEGKLSADGGTISGTAKNADGETTFQLTRAGEANVKLAAASTAIPKEFEGEWEGVVDSGGRVRKVGLKLATAADGIGSAVLIAGEQRMEIPVTTVAVKGKELTLEVRAISGLYRGTLGENAEIAGEWSEGGNRMAVTFKRVK
jgi:hypothetical protein